ncbi:MAG: ribonuclease PH [Microthrixaceae bacterium]|nr:ribonuclease PH [Microthrixaceae bacterium]
MRADGRSTNELRPHSFQRDFTAFAGGSVLVTFGDTKVLCTAMLDEDVPRWMRNSGKGWVTAEYSMLPGSSPERIRRETKGPKGRTQEIQRLIGRALRSVVDMEALGERQILIDCDVLQADGGTRTAAISGAYLALHDCLTRMVQAGLITSLPLLDELAAISVGVIDGEPCLDLPYVEDVRAETDMNVVMTGKGLFVEVQGTAEGAPFSRDELDSLLELAAGGIRQIHELQREYISVAPSARSFGR